jgi:hypothetical protein
LAATLDPSTSTRYVTNFNGVAVIDHRCLQPMWHMPMLTAAAAPTLDLARSKSASFRVERQPAARGRLNQRLPLLHSPHASRHAQSREFEPPAELCGSAPRRRPDDAETSSSSRAGACKE